MKPRGCFPETEEGWENYNKQYDVEQQDFIEELGNNGEELKDYPDEDPRDYSQDYEHDPMDVYHQIEDLLISTREILNDIEGRQL